MIVSESGRRLRVPPAIYKQVSNADQKLSKESSSSPGTSKTAMIMIDGASCLVLMIKPCSTALTIMQCLSCQKIIWPGEKVTFVASVINYCRL